MGRVLDLELEDPRRSGSYSATKQPSDLIHTTEAHFPHVLLGTVLPASLAYRLFAGSGKDVNEITLKCLHVIILLDCDSKSSLWMFFYLMSVREYAQQGFCLPVFSFQGHSLILTSVWERRSHTKGVSWNCGQGCKHPCYSLRLQFSNWNLQSANSLLKSCETSKGVCFRKERYFQG